MPVTRELGSDVVLLPACVNVSEVIKTLGSYQAHSIDTSLLLS